MPKINAFDAAAGRTVAIWHGDLFAESINVDLLVISAKQKFYEPVQGTMVKVLLDRCNIDVKALSETKALDLLGSPTIRGWVTPELDTLTTNVQWPQGSQTRFKRLVVLESPWPPEGEAKEGMVFEQLFRLLALLPLHGIQYNSVATPLLNTGEQKQPPDALFPAILDAVDSGFRHLPDLCQLHIVDLKQDALHRLSEQIDHRLHRTPLQKTVLSIQKEYRSVLEGLLNSITDFRRKHETKLRSEEAWENLSILDNELRGNQVTPVTLGSSARKLLEALVQASLRGKGKSQTLFQQVRLLGDDISAWSANAIHTVRTFGNWMCHATPDVEIEAIPRRDVAEDDILAVVLALRRVLDDYPWPSTVRPRSKRRRRYRDTRQKRSKPHGLVKKVQLNSQS